MPGNDSNATSEGSGRSAGDRRTEEELQLEQEAAEAVLRGKKLPPRDCGISQYTCMYLIACKKALVARQ